MGLFGVWEGGGGVLGRGISARCRFSTRLVSVILPFVVVVVESDCVRARAASSLRDLWLVAFAAPLSQLKQCVFNARHLLVESNLLVEVNLLDEGSLVMRVVSLLSLVGENSLSLSAPLAPSDFSS